MCGAEKWKQLALMQYHMPRCLVWSLVINISFSPLSWAMESCY